MDFTKYNRTMMIQFVCDQLPIMANGKVAPSILEWCLSPDKDSKYSYSDKGIVLLQKEKSLCHSVLFTSYTIYNRQRHNKEETVVYFSLFIYTLTILVHTIVRKTNG